jgi:hypothetical protein
MAANSSRLIINTPPQRLLWQTSQHFLLATPIQGDGSLATAVAATWTTVQLILVKKCACSAKASAALSANSACKFLLCATRTQQQNTSGPLHCRQGAFGHPSKPLAGSLTSQHNILNHLSACKAAWHAQQSRGTNHGMADGAPCNTV